MRRHLVPHRRWKAWLAALLLALPCMAGAGELHFAVEHTCRGEPLLLDSLRYENSAREIFSITRLSYLLSSFALQREADGAWLELPGQVLWFDAGRRRTEGTLAEIPPGRYRALRFVVGLDAATDGRDPASFAADHPLNPNLSGLHWGWQGGYLHLALEGRFRAGSEVPGGFVYHLARGPQRAWVHLTASLETPHDAGVVVQFDLADLLCAPCSLSFVQDGAATHSRLDDPVAAALRQNLAAAFHLRGLTSHALPARAATVAPPYLPTKFTPYRFSFSRTFPVPALPPDNPLLAERVSLGQRLFHEPLLSRDGAISCATCHQPDAGFADPLPQSRGVEGQAGRRHAMPLLNLAWKESFFWDGRATSLRAQALLPIQDHREMAETLPRVVAKLQAHPEYPALFAAGFGSPEITAPKLGLALEQFLLTLTAGDSRFDRAFRGQETLTPEEQQGFALFMTEYDPRTGQRGADCFHCHGGALFTDHQFHNNGLLPSPADPGRYEVTHRDEDRDKFATPSLRNIARTAPYMHDGRFATLEAVVAHYAGPVTRSPTLDPNLAKHPAGGLPLGAAEQRALVAFLQTLTESPREGLPAPARLEAGPASSPAGFPE